MGKRLSKETIEKLKQLKSSGLTAETIGKQLGISTRTVAIHTKGIKSTIIKKCSFPGCKKKYCAKGLCNSHWSQQQRYGKLSSLIRQETEEERFWRQVKKPLNEKEDCWLWLGPLTGGHGYGQVNYNGRRRMAHRVSYNIHIGEIGEGMQIDHLCRNRACVNPNHLQIVTQVENMKRNKLFYTMLSEIQRLRKFIQQLGENPGADIFAGFKFQKDRSDSRHEETRQTAFRSTNHS